ncbi:hypothetical protein PK35_01715 [Tamlana nanhaiensis]|uniref:Lipoprotein n=1 Tax=Neotamlana nanhaiensis TaxID=1382798 RepID=A0A0D7W745_9FLAO|nr:hypothetical protein [Tamlana nanhaiensis]KJD34533.1 hypothetical protein PK35_01715 [Tamlana nanhaiensis]
MKTLIILLGLSCFTQLCNAQLSTPDQKKHFAAGAIISGITYPVIYSTTKRKGKAFFISFGASVLAGFGKEIYDSQKFNSPLDKSEVLATALGGAFASTTFYIFTGKGKKKKQQQEIALVN